MRCSQPVQLAQQACFAITARELRLWAHDEAFAAPWWPWASGGRAQRMAFFRGEAAHAARGWAPKRLVRAESTEAPQVTLLIPLHNRWAITLNALTADGQCVHNLLW